MVGREMDEQFPRHATHRGEERLRLEDFAVAGQRGGAVAGWWTRSRLSVRAGEILGIGGLQGSGASDLLLGPVRRLRPRVRGRAFGSTGSRSASARRSRPSAGASPC